MTSAVSAALALAFGVVVSTGAPELWMIYGLTLLSGLVLAVERPAMQALLFQLVGGDLTGRSDRLGIAVALQFLPLLLLGAPAGVSSTSQVMASAWSHDPTLEITWPTKYRRKLGCSKAANRPITSPGGSGRRCRWSGRQLPSNR